MITRIIKKEILYDLYPIIKKMLIIIYLEYMVVGNNINIINTTFLLLTIFFLMIS